MRTWSDPTTAQVRALHLNDWGGNSFTVRGVRPDGELDLRWVGDNQRGNEPHTLYRMVENVLEELDSPGEWFHDRGTGRLSYWRAPDVDLETAVFETAELDELVRIDDSGRSTTPPTHSARHGRRSTTSNRASSRATASGTTPPGQSISTTGRATT